MNVCGINEVYSILEERKYSYTLVMKLFFSY